MLNYEEDIATYTIKAATNPRAANNVLTCKPQRNIISQLDLISCWEKKIRRTLSRIHIPELEIINCSERSNNSNLHITAYHKIKMADSYIILSSMDTQIMFLAVLTTKEHFISLFLRYVRENRT